MASSSLSDRLSVSRRAVLGGALAMLCTPRLARAAPAELDGLVEAEMRRAGIPGLALGYAREGRVAFARGYGLADLAGRRPVTADTVFPLASVTKTVTATAVMQLVEAGRLDLDAAVAPLLDFPLANPHHPELPITARHLLTHTSGLSDAKYYEIDFRTPGADATLGLRALLAGYLVPGGAFYDAGTCFAPNPPGAVWDYSNVGFALLGYLVERISGEDLRTRTRRTIFEPLGMRSAGWTIAGTPASAVTNYDLVDDRLVPVPPMGFPDYPVGMMRASASDLARFAAASANGGAADGGRMLGEAAMAQLLAVSRPAGLPEWLSGQALGWQVSPVAGLALHNHAGGDPGVFTFAFVRPETREGLAVLTNVTSSSASMAAVKAIAGRILGGA